MSDITKPKGLSLSKEHKNMGNSYYHKPNIQYHIQKISPMPNTMYLQRNNQSYISIDSMKQPRYSGNVNMSYTQYIPYTKVESKILYNNPRNTENNQFFQQMTKVHKQQMPKSISDLSKVHVQSVTSTKRQPKHYTTFNNNFQNTKHFDNKNQYIYNNVRDGYSRVSQIEKIRQKQKVKAESKTHGQFYKQSQNKQLNNILIKNDKTQQFNNKLTNDKTQSNPGNQLNRELQQGMKKLLQQIKHLNQNKKQARAIWIDINLQYFPHGQEQQNRIHNLKKQVFKIFSQIFSIGFQLHHKEGMEFQKVKAYISENVIINFCKFANQAKIMSKDMKILDQHLQQNILPFLNLSYPRSQEKTVDKVLKSKIVQKDIFNQNRFDIVYNSQVKMSTIQGQINSEVMKIMNYIIALLDEKIPFNQRKNTEEKPENNQRTLYESFQRDMELILSKVYNKKLVQKLYKFKIKEPIDFQSIIQENQNFCNTSELMQMLDKLLQGQKQELSQQNIKEKQKKERQQQEYKQKVKLYTNFKIGRKVPSNVEPYTKEQIQQGTIIIKDSSVARILMKWIQALEEQIKNPSKSLHLRDQPFRLSSQQQTYLLSSEQKLQQIQQFYERSAKVIQQKSQILKQNARRIFLQTYQSTQSISKFQQYRTFSSQNDATVGHICTILQKCRQNYISSCLNMLLGQIKYIQQQYQWQIQDKKANIPSRPSFISMRLGDLMRCQISSKPKQIIALYEYISLLCKANPKVFELIRVKDRSNTPNKDILLNVYYHQKIMIQIQLAIKDDSSFINSSDKFSHFLYELMRTFLGPINQLCSIWSQYSPKSQFFVRKFAQMNIRPNKISYPKLLHTEKDHNYEQQQRGFKLPFWCSNCGVLYYNVNIPRKRCINCKVYQCYICSRESNTKQFINQQYPEYEIIEGMEVGEIFYALDVLTSRRNIETMFKIVINGKTEVYSMKIQLGNKIDDNGNIIYAPTTINNIRFEFQQVHERHKQNFKKQSFLRSHILLRKKSFYENENKSNLINQIMKQILQNCYLPHRIKSIIKKSQSFIKISLNTKPKLSFQIKNQIVKKVINKNTNLLPLIEKLNISENGLDYLQIDGIMPKAKVVIVNHNILKSINLNGLQNLTILELSHNKIKDFKSIIGLKLCKNLKKLLLDQNGFQDLQGVPSQLQNLQILSLRKNQIRLVKPVSNLKNLKSLNLNQNKIQKLSGIQHLNRLVQLNLNGNVKLAYAGVQQLRHLSNLKKLYLSQTLQKKTLLQSFKQSQNIQNQNIPRNQILVKYQPLFVIKSLETLEQLDVSHNNITFIPKVRELINLKQLNLKQNSLKDLKNIQNLINLTWLNLKNNHITNIKGIKYLTNLHWVDMSKNQIIANSKQDLQEISYLKQLQQIQLSYNKLNIIDGLGQLPKLYQLSFTNNNINSLKGINKLSLLQRLDARLNNITSVKGIQNLKIMFQLKLSHNPLQNYRQLQFVQKLKILQLNHVRLKSITKIPRLKNLQQLYLNSNQIEILEGLRNFESLKTLEIANNPIKSFSDLKQQNLLNISYLFFTLTANLKLDFISTIDSLQTIKIHRHKFNEQTFEQNQILIHLSLLGYNLQFTETSQKIDSQIQIKMD